MRKPILSLLAAALMTSAAACTTTPVAESRPALDLRCDEGLATCSGSCEALPAWDSSDFDDLLGLGAADRLVLEACQTKLKACQACLARGRDAGVIR